MSFQEEPGGGNQGFGGSGMEEKEWKTEGKEGEASCNSNPSKRL